MNRNIRFKLSLIALMVISIPFFALSYAKESKEMKREIAAKYVAKKSVNKENVQFSIQRDANSLGMTTMQTSASSVPTIYGSLVYSSAWNSNDPKFGVYSIPTSDSPSELVADIDVSEVMTGALVGELYYVVSRRFEDNGAVSQIYLNSYNVNTWELHEEVELEPDWQYLPLVITYDAIDGEIYALKYSDDWVNFELATLNPMSGELTTISVLGDSGTMPTIMTLSGADNGLLYAVCTDGQLYSIEKQTGVMTAIGEIGCIPSGIQSTVYDYNTGILYWAAVTSFDDTMLCTIDMQTGEASVVNVFPDFEEYVGLYILNDKKSDSAPQKVEAELTFTYPAELTGSLDFTVPSKTIGGDAITSDLEVVITIDKIEYKSITASPGSQHSELITFEEGKHLVEIKAINGEESSKTTYLNVFAGYDAPKPVKNVHLEISNDNVATLTWDATDGSVNGGYVAFDELRYRVVRQDNTIAAENLTETVFSEQLTDEIKKYAYSVVAYTPDAESVAINSNVVRNGSYYTVPYFNNFEIAEDVDGLFTFINNNNDTSFEWAYANSYEEAGYVLMYYCNWNSTQAADDYAVTPSFAFEKEKLYRITFQHTINEMWDYVNDLDIFIGTEPKVNALTTRVADFWDISNSNSDSDTKEVLFTVPDDGKYYIAFHIYSAAGQGTFWINDLGIEEVGLADAPAKVDFELTAINEEPEKVDITLVAPTKTARGDELQSLKNINIYREGDDVPYHVIDNPQPGENYSWTDENPVMGLAKYKVVAENEIGEGYSEVKSVFVGGYIPPYVETFDKEENFNLFKIINANNDETTWYFNNGTAKYEYDVTNAANDWLFSPKIKMNSDRVYKVMFIGHSTQWNPENLKMTIGTKQETRDQTVLVNLQDWSVQENETHYAYYIPETDGHHYVGFHAYSKRAKTYIEIDELSVVDAFSVYAPAAVENLIVEPDLNGRPQATVKMTAPLKNAKGETISALTKIEIYREGTLESVHTFDAPAPGEILEWIDEDVVIGDNTYRIVPFNEHGEGIDKYIDAYIGYDTPSVVENLSIKGDAQNSNAIISWTAPQQGANGGYINASTLTYNVYKENEEGQFVLLANDLTETLYTDECNYVGQQKGFRYAVAAKTSEGISLGTVISVVLGDLYDIPFEESFENSEISTYQWTMSTPSTEACSLIMVPDHFNGTEVVYSTDSDGGMLRFYKWNDETDPADAYITSPKISLSSSESPCVSFYVYHVLQSNRYNRITPYISVNDGKRVALSEPIAIRSEETGWTRYSYSLEDYKDSDFVKVTLYAELFENSCSILVDGFVVDDAFDYNLAVNSFSGPSEIGVDGGEFVAEIKNRAVNPVLAYEVALYCDGECVETLKGENIEPFTTAEFKFKVESPSVAEAGELRHYYVELICAEDQKMSDNKSEDLEVVVYTPPYPTITDLNGHASDFNNANLSWTEPEMIYYGPTTDGFDSYMLFAIDDFGPWIVVDVDEQRTYGPKYGITFPHVFDPKAWQVFDPQRASLYAEDCAPHSGAKCLVSMQSDGQKLDGTYEEPYNDDWLISEEVIGGSKVGLWAKQPTSLYGGNEKFEILYSTTDQKISSFTLLEEVELQNMAVWNEYTFTLPEDAKYFAVRHTQSFFGLWIDDITYHAVSKYDTLTVEKYNIYRDGVKIGESNTTGYVDENLEDGIYEYAVSSHFNIGESALSNKIELVIDKSSVDEVATTEVPSIYAKQSCIIVENADGMIIELFTPDGKLQHREIGKTSLTIPVDAGIYIIKIDDTKKKIIVE